MKKLERGSVKFSISHEELCLLPRHKTIIDLLKNIKYDKNNCDDIEFISSSIMVQYEAQLIYCLNDKSLSNNKETSSIIDIYSNALVSKILNIIYTIIKNIVLGNEDISNNQKLLHLNTDTLFVIYGCHMDNDKYKNLIMLINYFCDSFSE